LTDNGHTAGAGKLPTVTVVVGVDGAGRTHRLGELAAATKLPVVRVDGRSEADVDLDDRLAAVAPGETLVIVDDAHLLGDTALRQLTAAAARGVAMAVARRPTIDRPALAELDEAASAQGTVEQLGPLDERALAALVSTVTGRPAPAEQVAAVREASAGHPAVAVAVAAAPPGTPPPALVAGVQQRLARFDAPTATLARVLALQLDLTDDVLAVAVGVGTIPLVAAIRSLRDGGLLVPGSERMIPAVAQAVLAELAPAERRRLHDAVALALVEAGGDPVAAAGQLSAAQARTDRAAEVYRAAADRLRFADPAAAMTWYDDALDAGADPATLAAGRAEAAALLGQPVDVDWGPAGSGLVGGKGTGPPVAAPDAVRIALAAGAVTAQQGRAARAAEALVAAGPPGPVLAAPALVAAGRLADARSAAAGDGPLALRLFAEASLAVGDPAVAVPLLIEAAEAMEATPPALVLPDTPHALGAVVAVGAGDAATAEDLLGRAIAAGIGGPVALDRHRTLLAWVRMRTGRYDTAVAELRRLADAPLPGRERLLVAALSAGIARRSGDIAQLRQAWAGAEPVLARRAVDLFQLEALEELVVAAARLRQQGRAAPVLDTVEQLVDRLGRPAAWVAAVGWIRLQVAVAGEDAEAAAAAAHMLSRTPQVAPRQAAQAAAAGLWAHALAGAVDADAVAGAADALAAAQLPWEASRLAGHAAIRTTDPAAARRLLERARELAGAEPAAAEARADSARFRSGSQGSPYGGLSDREVEVARLVLAGRTYREIGAQLYLSPKTVEHHVARIRTKLGATSRAELVAALRQVLEDQNLSD
jgi:DNA-binding CsgD family transcriptional regulator